MAQELVYTSVPRGLKPGSGGFCTVARTEGMSPQLVQALESLSAYRHLDLSGNTAANPTAYSHVRIVLGGRTLSVLSRVADAGLDYSERANKLAHHVAVELRERPTAGPVEFLSRPGFLKRQWSGEPHTLPVLTLPDVAAAELAICRAWAQQCGDAGWGGVLAESFLSEPTRPVYLLIEPAMQALPLFREALALLPADRRWDVTFSTYFTGIPPFASCAWRCVPRDSEEARWARRQGQAMVIDLCSPMPAAVGGPLVQMARVGIRPEDLPQRRPATPVQVSPPPVKFADYFEEEDPADEYPEAKRRSPGPVRDLYRPGEPAAQDWSQSPAIPVRRPPPPPGMKWEQDLETRTVDDDDREAQQTWQLAGVLIAVIVLGVGGWWWMTSGSPPAEVNPDGNRDLANRNSVAIVERQPNKNLPGDPPLEEAFNGGIRRPQGGPVASTQQQPGDTPSLHADSGAGAPKMRTVSGGAGPIEPTSPPGDSPPPPQPDPTVAQPAPATIRVRWLGREVAADAADGKYYTGVNETPDAIEIEATPDRVTLFAPDAFTQCNSSADYCLQPVSDNEDPVRKFTLSRIQVTSRIAVAELVLAPGGRGTRVSIQTLEGGTKDDLAVFERCLLQVSQPEGEPWVVVLSQPAQWTAKVVPGGWEWAIPPAEEIVHSHSQARFWLTINPGDEARELLFNSESEASPEQMPWSWKYKKEARVIGLQFVIRSVPLKKDQIKKVIREAVALKPLKLKMKAGDSVNEKNCDDIRDDCQRIKQAIDGMLSKSIPTSPDQVLRVPEDVARMEKLEDLRKQAEDLRLEAEKFHLRRSEHRQVRVGGSCEYSLRQVGGDGATSLTVRFEVQQPVIPNRTPQQRRD